MPGPTAHVDYHGHASEAMMRPRFRPGLFWAVNYLVDYAVVLVLAVVWGTVIIRLTPAQRSFDPRDPTGSISWKNQPDIVSNQALFQISIYVPLVTYLIYQAGLYALVRTRVVVHPCEYVRASMQPLLLGSDEDEDGRLGVGGNDRIEQLGEPSSAVDGAIHARIHRFAQSPAMYALLESHVYLLAFMASFWFNVCITDLLKVFAGRLRPDFLDRCQWSDLHHACTGDPRVIMEGRRSWPSGHSSIAFSTLGFLALFLAAKGGLLRPPVTPAPHATPATHIADARWTPLTPWVKGRVWPFVVAVAPLLVAGYIAISRTVQHIHHPTDVISGSLLGFTIATLAFRNYFTWDGTPRSPLVHLDDDGSDYTRLHDADHA